jgi:hypothetical protein
MRFNPLPPLAQVILRYPSIGRRSSGGKKLTQELLYSAVHMAYRSALFASCENAHENRQSSLQISFIPQGQ